jgi:hypothetical protein
MRDVIVGLTAIPLLAAVARNPSGHRGRLLAWNALGTLDLISAVTLGVISAPGSPLQVLGGTLGSAAIWALPWSNIPTLLVPFYLTTHGTIFVRLAQPPSAAPREQAPSR